MVLTFSHPSPTLQHPYVDLEYTVPTSRLLLGQKVALKNDSREDGGWAGLSSQVLPRLNHLNRWHL